MANEEGQKFAWEIELEQYRRRKRVDRLLIAGALCGIVSLAVSVYILIVLL